MSGCQAVGALEAACRNRKFIQENKFRKICHPVVEVDDELGDSGLIGVTGTVAVWSCQALRDGTVF